MSDSDRFSVERTLCAAVAAGERSAAAELAKRLLPYVRRVAHSLLSNSSDAEDATQAAIVEILQSARSYTGRGSLEAWAHRISARVTLRRARKTRAQRVSEFDDDHDVPNGEQGELEGASLARPLEDYLAEISDVQREALLLRHALGHTVPEISEMTQSPIPTVKSRILKGQQELRRLIRRDLRIGRKKTDSP